jgi:hypothetical protein
MPKSRKEKRFKSHGSRWGPGKVHRLVWNYENKVWYIACLKPYEDYYGVEVHEDTEVTCKKCLR